MKITENSTLKEVLKIEGIEKVLLKHNVPCVSCPFAKIEMENLTLKNIAESYNINLKKLVDDIKKIAK